MFAENPFLIVAAIVVLPVAFLLFRGAVAIMRAPESDVRPYGYSRWKRTESTRAMLPADMTCMEVQELIRKAAERVVSEWESATPPKVVYSDFRLLGMENDKIRWSISIGGSPFQSIIVRGPQGLLVRTSSSIEWRKVAIVAVSISTGTVVGIVCGVLGLYSIFALDISSVPGKVSAYLNEEAGRLIADSEAGKTASRVSALP